MIDASYVTEFDKTVKSACDLLHNRPNQGGEMETNLEMFYWWQQHHAIYCPQEIGGSYGQYGLVAAIINHSSVLCYLNDNHVETNTYYENQIIICKDLPKRHKKTCADKNQWSLEMKQVMQIELSKPLLVTATPLVIHLIKMLRRNWSNSITQGSKYCREELIQIPSCA